MKRRIIKKPKSKAAKQALKQLRQTRAQISKENPELLERFAQLLSEPKKQEVSETLPIDREKNLHTVMAFLEQKKHFSSEFQNRLKEIIQETQ